MESLPKNLSFAMPILTCARWHDAVCCSPQDCAGRSLPQRRPAIVHECSRRGPRRLLPEQQATTRKRKKRQKMHVFCWMLQLFVLLLDQAIRQMRRESHCRHSERGNLQKNGNKRMSSSGRYRAPIGWSTSKRTAP